MKRATCARPPPGRLGKIGDPRAVEPLLAALGDEKSDVRWAAAKALGQIGTPAGELLLAALRESQNLTTCLTCRKRTPIPTENPPFGIPLICMHCMNPLIRLSGTEEAPNETPPNALRLTYGYTGRYLEHPRCPRCQKLNYSIVFPAAGYHLPWWAVTTPRGSQGSFIQIACRHCHGSTESFHGIMEADIAARNNRKRKRGLICPTSIRR